MYIVGLTGGIATGKSTVSAMLAELGAYIIDTDKIAHAVVLPGQPAFHAVVAHFGGGIVRSDGTLNREVLGEIIFKSPEERTCLERITHPFIEKRVNEDIQKGEELGYKLVVVDVPLLFEVGWQNKVDEVWVVYVDQKVQISRLIARNQLTYEQAQIRINAQLHVEEKAKQADVVIDNTLDKENTKKQVISAWQDVCNRAQNLTVEKV